MSWGSFWHHVTHVVHHAEHDISSAAREAEEKAKEAAEAAKRAAERAAEIAKEEAERLRNLIESDYLKIKDEVKGVAEEAVHSMVNRLHLADLSELAGNHLFFHQLANDPISSYLKAGEYWGDSFSVTLVPESPGVDPLKAPVLTITPKFEVASSSFNNSIDVKADGSLDFGSLSFKGFQGIEDQVSAKIDVNLGVDVSLRTFDAEGGFVIPASFGADKDFGKNGESSGSRGSSEESEGKEGQAQESDGLFSLSAGVSLEGGVEVESEALNKTFSFGVTQPLTLAPDLDLNIGLTENFDAGSIWAMAKKVATGRMGLGSVSEVIKDSEFFSAYAKVVDDKSWEQQLRFGTTHVESPDDLTGLGSFFSINPELTASFGLVLEEENVGLDLASIDNTISFKNKFSFEDGSSPEYELIGSIGSTASVFKVGLGPATLAPLELPLWNASWKLLGVDLADGDVSGPQGKPTVSLV